MPPMPSLGPLINRVLRPLRGYYNRTPGFERIVNRAIWSVTVPWPDLASAGEKVRLLATVRPCTMVHGWGLSKIYELCREIERRGILGAYAECGVWKGGCGGVMGYWAAKSASRRKVWLFDSFEGLPEPTPEDSILPGEAGAGRREDRLRPIGTFVAAVEDVHELLFATLGLDPAGIVIEKGWFQDTLPEARSRIGPVALLRLDSDLYASTKCCLENLYDNVVPGGYVIIDDYLGWPGCRQAVDEYFASRGIEVTFRRVDPLDRNWAFSAVYFQKPSPAPATGYTPHE